MTANLLSDGTVRLRAVEPTDAVVMYDIENDPDIWAYSRRQAPLSMRTLSEYAAGYDADPLRSGQLRLMIESIADDDVCGIIDLYDISAADRNAWVGIVILPEYRGRGLGRAALDLISGYSRRLLGIHALGAKIASDNAPSRRLFESAGYAHCGTLPGWLQQDSAAADLLLYVLNSAAE